MNVPRFMSVALRGWSELGTTCDATAEAPNAIDPTRFSAVIRQDRLRGRQDHRDRPTSNQASQLLTRKQIDPKASGDQTSRSAWVADRCSRERVEGADVEEHRSGQLHGGGPPLDALRLPAERSQPPPGSAAVREAGDVDDLQVLEGRGDGEEQRPHEERDAVGGDAHGVDVARGRPHREAQGADGEQDADPPPDGARGPPGRPPAGVEERSLLAQPARRPPAPPVRAVTGRRPRSSVDAATVADRSGADVIRSG